MKIVSVEEMRRIEEAANAGGHSYAAMMEQAGDNIATMVTALQLVMPQKNALILVGPGNNGGDGLVAARLLRERGYDVTLYIWKRDIKGDENFSVLKRKRRGIAILWADNDPDFAKLREETRRASLVIDALLGTGAVRAIEGKLAALMQVVKTEIAARRTPDLSQPEQQDPTLLSVPLFPLLEAQSLGLPPIPPPSDRYDPQDLEEEEMWEEDEEGLLDEDWEEDEAGGPWPALPVLAVDCPSGLNCDTGALDPAAIPADLTVTFAFPKWGHLQYPGAGACGLLAVVDIGVRPELAAEVPVALINHAFVGPWLPGRPADAHKGSFGRVMIVAGSFSYPGAAVLSGAAAARAGAGLVTLAIPAALHPALAGALPEATWLPLPGPEGTHTAAGVARLLAGASGYDALLIGPGLTTEESARAFIDALLSPAGLAGQEWRGRTVIDADALNILATLPDWPQRLPPGSILTPHPGEMGRLIGATADQVNGQRIATARRWATEWGHIVLLKGPHTVVAAPDGRTGVLPFALPALATAGSGDVLAGAIVSLLGQGLPAFEAAAVGAYLHGHAGQRVSRQIGMAGALAGDIARELPGTLRDLRPRA